MQYCEILIYSNMFETVRFGFNSKELSCFEVIAFKTINLDWWMVPLSYPQAPEVGKRKTREVIYHTDMNRI